METTFEKALENLQGARIREAIGAVVAGEAAEVVRDLQSRQTGLGNVSGRLRAGYRATGATMGTATVSAAIENDVPYARAHEFGVNRVVSVREHKRAGRKVPWVTVKAHSMRMNLPAQHMLQQAVEGRKEALQERVAEAMIGAVAGR